MTGDLAPTNGLTHLKPGDRVRVVCPENTRLHDAEGTVAALASWGAHLTLPAAKMNCFRAAWSEMQPIRRGQATHPDQPPAEYTGEVCTLCGGTKMRRTGACSTCENCGESGGCA